MLDQISADVPKKTLLDTTPVGLPRRAMDLVEEFLELGRKVSWLQKNNINTICMTFLKRGNHSVSLGKHSYFDVYAGPHPQKIP